MSNIPSVEKVLEEHICQTYNITEKAKSIECYGTEKSRDSKFPCYSILAEHLEERIEIQNGSAVVVVYNQNGPTSSAHIDGSKLVHLYDNYKSYSQYFANELHCATLRCNVPPLQNQREVEHFVKHYGHSKRYRCYFSVDFDRHAALLSRTIDEIHVVELIAWPAGVFVVGVIIIILLYLVFGCGIWEDTVMV